MYENPKTKIYQAFIFCLLTLLCAQKNLFAQDGMLNDDFSTGNLFNWKAATTGSTGQIVNGQFVVTMPPSTTGKYRADIQKVGGLTLHAGNYPIVAVKMNKPPRCNFFFDTNLGSYNNTNNNATKIETPTGNIYYWDLSTGKLGTTILPKDAPTTLSVFQFKVAEIVLTQAEIDAGDYSYEVDWVKTFSSVDALRAFANPTGNTNPVFEYSGAFAHPGLLHSTTDLARIKDLVTRQVSRPYRSYQLLLASNRSSASYTKAGPFKYLTRDASLTIETPTGSVSGGAAKNGVEGDFMAAYYNALMWNITGNEAHAQKATEIIDAYAAFTEGIIGSDAELNGLYGFILANAAELMRYTYPAWGQEKIQQCESMLKSVFYPTLQNFRPCAHGNWDIICMKGLMAIAIFTNDNAMYNKVVNYFYYGEGNGSIDNYVLTEAGQLQESNRDQPHTMLAIGSLAELAEMALRQGLDLYTASNNAIMRGYEYTAKYNLGYTVPYQTSYDFCEKNYQDYTPEAISPRGRGQFRAVFEIAYNHYVYRKGLQMPNTLEVLGVMGPEGAPFGADNPGYGSLFFYLNSNADYVFPNGGGTDPAKGFINDNFTGITDGWVAATTGSTATSENGELKVTTVMQSTGKLRGDMKKSAGATVHPGNYPILAIKMKKPAVANLTFDTNLGAYGNGANKWTGKIGDDIYYYDLTKGFGSNGILLSTTVPTTLSTFQFKVADITSGETSYTVDWVKTVKSVNELLAFDPNAGLINDNFNTSTDGWSANTSGATVSAENGQLKVNLAQVNGKGRGDIKKNTGATLYPANYPIVAIKLKKPAVANITFDTNMGSFGNGSNRQTGKIGDDIYYFDLTKTGFGASGTLLTAPTALTLFQFKVADITSGETTYLVDWVKTVKTVDELQNFVAPRYQTINFPALTEKKVGDEDFTPATASSGLLVNLSSSNETVATIVDGKVHIVGAGVVDIMATQTGNSDYYPADPVTRTLNITKREQTITFNALPDIGVVNADFDAGATVSSGLGITYTSSNPAVATIENGKIHLTGVGTAIITAAQEGNYMYHAAESVSQSLVVFDNQPPTQPQALTAAKRDDGKLQLMWQASSDNVGVTGYYVFQDGKQLNETAITGSGYITDAPIGSLMYTYTVIATDAAGNLSQESASETFTNSNGNGAFNTGYEILKVFPNPSDGNFKVRLNSIQTGAIVISIYNAGGALVQRVSDNKSGEVYQKEFNLHGLPFGTYHVQVIVGVFNATKIILLQ